MCVRVVIKPVGTGATAGHVHVGDSFEWNTVEEAGRVDAVIAPVRVEIRKIEQQQRAGAVQQFAEEIRFAHWRAGALEQRGDVFERQRHRQHGLCGAHVAHHDFERLVRAWYRQQMAGLDSAAAHEREVLAHQRCVQPARQARECAQARAIRQFGAAERKRNTVRDHRDTTAAQFFDRRRQRALEPEILRQHFDETEIATALDQQREFGAPADAETKVAAERQRHAFHPPQPPQPPPPQPPLHEPPPLPPSDESCRRITKLSCIQASSLDARTCGPNNATASNRPPSPTSPMRRRKVVCNAAFLRFRCCSARSPRADRSGRLKNLTPRMIKDTTRNTARKAPGRPREMPIASFAAPSTITAAKGRHFAARWHSASPLPRASRRPCFARLASVRSRNTLFTLRKASREPSFLLISRYTSACKSCSGPGCLLVTSKAPPPGRATTQSLRSRRTSAVSTARSRPPASSAASAGRSCSGNGADDAWLERQSFINALPTKCAMI